MIARRKRMTKTKKLVRAAFHELRHNEPASITRHRERHGDKAAMKMRIAIALSKARKAGARLPKYKKKAA